MVLLWDRIRMDESVLGWTGSLEVLIITSSELNREISWVSSPSIHCLGPSRRGLHLTVTSATQHNRQQEGRCAHLRSEMQSEDHALLYLSVCVCSDVKWWWALRARWERPCAICWIKLGGTWGKSRQVRWWEVSCVCSCHKRSGPKKLFLIFNCSFYFNFSLFM